MMQLINSINQPSLTTSRDLICRRSMTSSVLACLHRSKRLRLYD